ncbi:MAG: hypothetical protein KIS66_13695 [Fimbriimonadaceae bacterium]|nr:hypothetical protein [Fimbriimonadaceae bacterium]
MILGGREYDVRERAGEIEIRRVDLPLDAWVRAHPRTAARIRSHRRSVENPAAMLAIIEFERDSIEEEAA